MIIAAFWAGLSGAVAFVAVTRRHRLPVTVTPDTGTATVPLGRPGPPAT